MEELHSSRGCAFGDFDNDGDLDILIVNLNEPPSLLRNDLTGDNRWLKVKLIGTKSNRSAIGARVVARYGGKQQVQEVISQSSYLLVQRSPPAFRPGESGDRRSGNPVARGHEADLREARRPINWW